MPPDIGERIEWAQKTFHKINRRSRHAHSFSFPRDSKISNLYTDDQSGRRRRLLAHPRDRQKSGDLAFTQSASSPSTLPYRSARCLTKLLTHWCDSIHGIFCGLLPCGRNCALPWRPDSLAPCGRTTVRNTSGQQSLPLPSLPRFASAPSLSFAARKYNK